LALWPTQSRAELVGASARSLPRIFTLTFVSEIMAGSAAEYTSAEIKHRNAPTTLVAGA
jgi:hypothetical protein